MYFRFTTNLLERFIGWIENDSDPWVRAASIEALSNSFPLNPRTKALLMSLLDASDEIVRSAVVTSLIENYRDDPQTLLILHDYAVNDKSPTSEDKKLSEEYYIREIAINALAEYWPTHPYTLVLLNNCAKNDPTPWLRDQATELIDQLEGKRKEDSG